MRTRVFYNKFNRGEVDPLALARDDVEKVNSSAELMENWWPMRLGPMMHRPGLEFKTRVPWSREFMMVPFQRSSTERAVLMFRDNILNIYTIDVDDNIEPLPGHAATTAFVNGGFDADLDGWTDSSTGSATTAWDSAGSGSASLDGAGTGEAVLYQTLTTEINVEHVMRVLVQEAPITIQIGYGGVGSNEVYESVLKPGVHLLNFSPTGQVTVTLRNSHEYRALVSDIDFPLAAEFDFWWPKFYDLSSVNSDTIRNLKWDQSGDIVYFALGDVPQFQVERRSTKSWSVVLYRCDDGPFGNINTTDITLTSSEIAGNATLTASRAYFKPSMIGKLFKLVSSGQRRVQHGIIAEDNGTDTILVSGVGDARIFNIQVGGVSGDTVTLQRSIDEIAWEDIQTYTADIATSYNDELDNGLYYYRLYVKVGDYSAGTINLGLNYASGSIAGIGRMTGYTSTTQATIQILEEFGATTATRDWYTSQWGGDEGYPSAVQFYEGRLWFAGHSQLWGSASDAYNSHNRDEELGNSRAIYRTIGFGPTDGVNWMKRGNGFVIGVLTDEIAVRSSTYGEILTQSNANLRSGNNQGSSSVPPERADNVVYFAHSDNKRLMGLTQVDVETFTTDDETKLNPSICKEGIRRIAVSRQPDTRIYTVLDDGTARVMLIDDAEKVKGWFRVVSGEFDLIKDAVSIRGINGRVILVVMMRYSPNAGTVHTIEMLAREDDAQGGTLSHNADSFLTFTSPGSSFSLDENPSLWGQELWVWADGEYRGLFTAIGSTLNLGASYNSVLVGLPVTAVHKCNKLFGYIDSHVLGEDRRVVDIGFIGRNIWRSTLEYSYDGSTYYPLPSVEGGDDVDQEELILEYDEPEIPFDGTTDTDVRVWLRATGPATIMAIGYGIESNGPPSAR